MQLISPSLLHSSKKKNKKTKPFKSSNINKHIKVDSDCITPLHIYRFFCSKESTTIVSLQLEVSAFLILKQPFKYHPSLETFSKPSGTRQQQHHIPDNIANTSHAIKVSIKRNSLEKHSSPILLFLTIPSALAPASATLVSLFCGSACQYSVLRGLRN